MKHRERPSGRSGMPWAGQLALLTVAGLVGLGAAHRAEAASRMGERITHTAAGKPAEGRLEPFLGSPQFMEENLFDGGRFPNVVVTTAGTVLATWGREKYRVRRSEDGGRTWGREIPIADGIHSGGVTVDDRTGHIFVFVENKHPPAPQSVYRSTDDGRSWQKIDAVIHRDERGNRLDLHMGEHGITLRHGTHAGRLLRPARVFGRQYDGLGYNTALYSDDGGLTWRPSSPFPVEGTGEGTLAELSDGRIYYNSRRHALTPDVDDVNPASSEHRPGFRRENPRVRYFAWSDDGGRTWKDVAQHPDLPDGPVDIDYGLMAGLVRLPVAGRDILLYSSVESASGRRGGTVWASFDGGRTWPLKRRAPFYEQRHAYSSLAAGRPGTASEGWIYWLFERPVPSEGRGGHGIGVVARFNLAWLMDTERFLK